jgi:hypothetical protein
VAVAGCAGAHAVMLHRDLKEAGYNVFLDFHSLGSGDYVDNIYKAIDECEDFILMLSQDALNERIYDENDIMVKEIMRAHEKNKPIIGIMLDGFEEFPQNLPEKLSFLPRVNCLSGKMVYYDAMFQRLTSGAFLISRPKNVVDESNKSNKINTLEWFKNLSFQDKSAYMKLLLDLSHEFESAPARINFYHYVEDFYRNFGIRETPPYNGDMPYDIVTYLAFFEPLYLILVSETLDISLVDEMFRYRFFAAVNNPTVQNSELLPQWNAYTNISALYDLWFEYLRSLNEKEDGYKSMNDIVYLFNYDLHKRQNIYRFVTGNFTPLNINFINKRSAKKELTLRLLRKEDKKDIVILQNEICQQITDKSIFVSLSDEEIDNALVKHLSFGLYENNKLIAFCLLMLNPDENSDLAKDCGCEEQSGNAVIDCMFTAPESRGFEIQKFLITVSVFVAARNKKERVFATVSPDNYFSTNNFLKSGFKIINTKMKYGFMRDFFMLTIDNELKKLFVVYGNPGEKKD